MLGPRLPLPPLPTRRQCRLSHLPSMACSRHPLSPFPSFSYSKSDEWSHLYHRMVHVLKIFPRVLYLRFWFPKRLPASFFAFLPTQAIAQLHSVSFDSSHAASINDAFVQCLAGCCPALRHLGIQMCKVTDVGVCALAHACRLLESLDVSFGKVTDNGIDTLLRMCPNMEYLDVNENYRITGWAFRHGKNLTTLKANCLDDRLIKVEQMATGPNASNTDNETFDMGAWGEDQPALAVIGVCCKHLVELSLTWSGLSDVLLQAIARACPNLEFLVVAYCKSITVLGWRAVALSCSKLELLDAQGCDQFCEDSLFAIYSGCPSLKRLKINHCFFPPNPVFKLFQMFRPDVDIRFYDETGRFCPLA